MRDMRYIGKLGLVAAELEAAAEKHRLDFFEHIEANKDNIFHIVEWGDKMFSSAAKWKVLKFLAEVVRHQHGNAAVASDDVTIEDLQEWVHDQWRFLRLPRSSSASCNLAGSYLLEEVLEFQDQSIGLRWNLFRRAQEKDPEYLAWRKQVEDDRLAAQEAERTNRQRLEDARSSARNRVRAALARDRNPNLNDVIMGLARGISGHCPLQQASTLDRTGSQRRIRCRSLWRKRLTNIATATICQMTS